MQLSALFLSLLCLHVTVLLARRLDNRLLATPTVSCGPDSLTIEAQSEDVFEGQIYIKNQRRTSPDCYKLFDVMDNSTKPSYSLSLSSISSCGLEMRRVTESKALQLSAVIVFSFHSSFVTAGDRAFAVNCLFQQKDYPVTTRLDFIKDIHSTLLQGVADIPTVDLNVVPGRLPISQSNDSHVEIGQPVMLVWHLSSSYVYGMRVLDCAAESRNGRGMSVLVDGCSQDKNLVSDVRYSDEHERAFSDVTAFKFPDEDEVFFRCHVKLCIRKFEHLVVGNASTTELCSNVQNCDTSPPSRRKRSSELDDSIIVVQGTMKVNSKEGLEEAKAYPFTWEKEEKSIFITSEVCLPYRLMAVFSAVSLTFYSMAIVTIISIIYLSRRKSTSFSNQF